MTAVVIVRKSAYPSDPAKPWCVQTRLERLLGIGKAFATLQEAHTYALIETRGWSR